MAGRPGGALVGIAMTGKKSPLQHPSREGQLGVRKGRSTRCCSNRGTGLNLQACGGPELPQQVEDPLGPPSGPSSRARAPAQPRGRRRAVPHPIGEIVSSPVPRTQDPPVRPAGGPGGAAREGPRERRSGAFRPLRHRPGDSSTSSGKASNAGWPGNGEPLRPARRAEAGRAPARSSRLTAGPSQTVVAPGLAQSGAGSAPQPIMVSAGDAQRAPSQPAGACRAGAGHAGGSTVFPPQQPRRGPPAAGSGRGPFWAQVGAHLALIKKTSAGPLPHTTGPSLL